MAPLTQWAGAAQVEARQLPFCFLHQGWMLLYVIAVNCNGFSRIHRHIRGHYSLLAAPPYFFCPPHPG